MSRYLDLEATMTSAAVRGRNLKFSMVTTSCIASAFLVAKFIARCIVPLSDEVVSTDDERDVAEVSLPDLSDATSQGERSTEQQACITDTTRNPFDMPAYEGADKVTACLIYNTRPATEVTHSRDDNISWIVVLQFKGRPYYNKVLRNIRNDRKVITCTNLTDSTRDASIFLKLCRDLQDRYGTAYDSFMFNVDTSRKRPRSEYGAFDLVQHIVEHELMSLAEVSGHMRNTEDISLKKTWFGMSPKAKENVWANVIEYRGGDERTPMEILKESVPDTRPHDVDVLLTLLRHHNKSPAQLRHVILKYIFGDLTKEKQRLIFTGASNTGKSRIETAISGLLPSSRIMIGRSEFRYANIVKTHAKLIVISELEKSLRNKTVTEEHLTDLLENSGKISVLISHGCVTKLPEFMPVLIMDQDLQLSLDHLRDPNSLKNRIVEFRLNGPPLKAGQDWSISPGAMAWFLLKEDTSIDL